MKKLKEMKTILNKTKRSSERYTLIDGSMGNYGEPDSSPNHYFQIVSGIDRGNGYQGYVAVSYFLSDEYKAPTEAKKACIKALRKEGFII